MRYMGGKARIAKKIVDVMAPHVGDRVVWDAFCGGLSVSCAFAARGFEVIATDENAALINLYRAVRDGWVPPSVATDAQRKDALKLPDTDPRKAFLRIGCAFGGNYNGGSAIGRGHPGEDICGASKASLLRDVPQIWHFDRCNFLEEKPEPLNLFIYCDPPYAGTRPYRQGTFDSFEFWRRCDEWIALGVPVFVSEYAAPDHWECIWDREQAVKVSRDKTPKKATERLFTRRL